MLLPTIFLLVNCGCFWHLFDGFLDSGYSNFPSSIDFWIGANNVKSYPGSGFNNPWIWTKDTMIVDFSNWGINEPSPGGNCASINIQGAFWSAQNCNSNKPYVCQIPASIGICEEGWTLLEHTQFCYKFMAISAGSQVAEQYCVQHNSHLASIHDIMENEFVANLASMNLQTSESKSAVWIGLVNDNNKTHWMWTDGSVVNFTSWAPNNPNSNYANIAVALYPDMVVSCKPCQYNWDDVNHPSNNLRGFVCKKNSMKGLLLA